MRGGEPRQCKFGPNCNKLAQGTCTYYHPPSDMNNMPPQQPRNPQGSGSGFVHHSYQGNYQPKNYNQNNPDYNRDNRSSNYHQNNPRQPSNNFNPNYNPNQGPRGFKEGIGGDDVVQKQLCRNFHLGIECKFGEKCRNKHGFTITE